MKHVPAALKAEVERGAGSRCEYCRLSQAGQEARFHVDHILPMKLGGATTLENLCLPRPWLRRPGACINCVRAYTFLFRLHGPPRRLSHATSEPRSIARHRTALAR
jgi:hypothetical protein